MITTPLEYSSLASAGSQQDPSGLVQPMLEDTLIASFQRSLSQFKRALYNRGKHFLSVAVPDRIELRTGETIKPQEGYSLQERVRGIC